MRNIPALLAKARACMVRYVNATSFDVHTPKDTHHIVTVLPGSALRHNCDCTFRHWRPEETCTHIIAVELLLAKQEQVRLSFWYYHADAVRQHRTVRILDDLYITVRRY